MTKIDRRTNAATLDMEAWSRFAAAALQGDLSASPEGFVPDIDHLVRFCSDVADKLCEEYEKRSTAAPRGAEPAVAAVLQERIGGAMNTNDKRIAVLMRADKDQIADLKCKLAEAEDEIEQHCRWIEDAYRREEQYKRQLADAHRALENVQKNCCCNRQKGFDYGEKHPTLGVHPSGRWLTPKEIAGIALREAGKCGLEK